MIEAWRNSVWMRRLLFVAANLMALIAIVVLVAIPIRVFFVERDDQIATQRVALARLLAIVAEEAAVQKLATQSNAGKDPVEFLRGPNEGVIGAELQTRLQGVVQSAGARVRSVRALPPKTRDQFKFIGAQIELTGPIGAVRQAVYAIESATPYLFVEAATIKPSAQINKPPGAAGNAEEPTIDAQLDVVGALQIERR